MPEEALRSRLEAVLQGLRGICSLKNLAPMIYLEYIRVTLEVISPG
jgi:hypothetical protein